MIDVKNHNMCLFLNICNKKSLVFFGLFQKLS
jgi:hypothetical protein